MDKDKIKRGTIALLDKAEGYIFIGHDNKRERVFCNIHIDHETAINLLIDLIESEYPELIDLIFMRKISQKLSIPLGIEEFAKFFQKDEDEDEDEVVMKH